MSRDISPPPSKRRKTEALETILPRLAPSPLSTITPPIGTGVLRIISWNVNGIAPFLQKSITSFFHAPRLSNDKTDGVQGTVPPPSLRTFLQRHDWPAFLLLQEVKVAANDQKTHCAVRAAVNSPLPSEANSGARGPKYEAHFTLPTDLHNARGPRGSGKVYGVCSIFRSDFREEYKINVRGVDWDSEGRVSVIELIRASKKLALFNIYAVNGTENPYRNPVTGALQGTRHDRKLEFHRLLMQECKGLEAENWLVLLAGDMNVAPDARDGYPKLRTSPPQHILNREDFHEKFLQGNQGSRDGFGGIDIWREMHETERRYSFFPRGIRWGSSCDRVDYFIAGRKTWEERVVKACGIMDTEAERGPSDHVPIWADIKLDCNNVDNG